MDEDAERRSATVNGIHMIRTAQQIHVALSQMADQKASILMGATFVIFTITIGQSRSGLAPVPLLILGGFAFFSAVCAMLAVLPAAKGPPAGAPVNLLFFASFTRLDEEEYVDRILNRLDRDDKIYETMVRDMYQNGCVLARKKYRYLGYAYRIFLAGLCLSFVAFVGEVAAAYL